MRTRPLIVVSASLAAVLLVAACGGSSNNGSSTTTGGAGSGSTTSSISTGNSDLDALLQKSKTANVKVTYKSDKSSDTFTQVQHDGNTAFITGNSGFYTVDGKTYTCQDLNTQPACVAMPSIGGVNPASAATTGFFGVYAALFSASSSFASRIAGLSKTTSNETIAGRDAKCVTLDGSAFGESGSITACIDSETGVFLKGSTSTSAGAGGSIEATSFAKSTADDVKLPAQPTSIPGMGGDTTTSY